MEALAETPPTGRNKFAPKTSSGTRERTPTCRGRRNRISDRRETHGRVAASIMGQSDCHDFRGAIMTGKTNRREFVQVAGLATSGLMAAAGSLAAAEARPA